MDDPAQSSVTEEVKKPSGDTPAPTAAPSNPRTSKEFVRLHSMRTSISRIQDVIGESTTPETVDMKEAMDEIRPLHEEIQKTMTDIAALGEEKDRIMIRREALKTVWEEMYAQREAIELDSNGEATNPEKQEEYEDLSIKLNLILKELDSGTTRVGQIVRESENLGEQLRGLTEELKEAMEAHGLDGSKRAANEGSSTAEKSS